jgi:hypothetical protein
VTHRPFGNVVAAALRNASWFVCGCGYVRGDLTEFLVGVVAAFMAGYVLAVLEDRI